MRRRRGEGKIDAAAEARQEQQNDANGSHCQPPTLRRKSRRETERGTVAVLGVLVPDVLWQLCHMRLLKKKKKNWVSVCSALIEATSRSRRLRSPSLSPQLTAASVAKELYLFSR